MTEQYLVENDNDWMYIFDPRGPEVYTGDIKNAIDIITLDKDQPPKIVGSFKYRVHKYPGDIDMLELYSGCCTLAEAKRDIVKRIIEMAKRIKEHKDVYLGDFKAGIDKRFQINIGAIKNHNIINYDSNKIIKDINKLYENKLLNKEQMLHLYDLIPEKPTIEQWKLLNEKIRKYYIVRWSLNELIKGKKNLIGKRLITLSSAISQGTVVKIDIFTKINGRYTEITNFFALSARNKNGELIPLTEEFADYCESLQTEIIEKIKEGKYLKVAKRLWLLALNKKDVPYLKKLYPLFSSPAAQLRQIAAESETMASMLDILYKPPCKDIKTQIDGFKLRIADIPSTILSEGTRRILYDIVDDAVETKNTEHAILKLNEFTNILSEIYNLYSQIYLQSLNLV